MCKKAGQGLARSIQRREPDSYLRGLYFAFVGSGDPVLVLVQRGADDVLLEDITIEPPRHHSAKLVLGVRAGRHTKDVVKLLQALLLRLWNKAENEGQGDEIHACVEAKRTSRGHGPKHTREGQTQNGSPEIVCRDSP